MCPVYLDYTISTASVIRKYLLAKLIILNEKSVAINSYYNSGPIDDEDFVMRSFSIITEKVFAQLEQILANFLQGTTKRLEKGFLNMLECFNTITYILFVDQSSLIKGEWSKNQYVSMIKVLNLWNHLASQTLHLLRKTYWIIKPLFKNYQNEADNAEPAMIT